MSAWNTGSNRSPVSPRRPNGSRGIAGPHIGPVRITPMRAVIVIAFVGSLAYIGWAIIKVRDSSQIPMLSSGFAILGVACVALAVGAVIEMWRASIRVRTGKAMALAIGGGLAGLAAIGCFTATVIFALLWKT
jgi:hypothetical protein